MKGAPCYVMRFDKSGEIGDSAPIILAFPQRRP